MLNYLTLYLLPVLSAILAWLLFRFGIHLLVNRLYRRRLELLQQVALQLKSGLLNPEALSKKLNDPARLAEVKPMIEQHVHTFLHVKLQEKLPVIAMFASAEMLGKIKEGLLEEIDLLLPEVISQYTGKAAAGLDLNGALADRLDAMTETAVKNAIRQLLAKGIGPAELVAALFGLIVGAVPLLFFIA